MTMSIGKKTSNKARATVDIKGKRLSAQLRAEGNAAGSLVGVAATLKRLLSDDDGQHDSLVVSMAYELGLDIIEGRLQPGETVNSVELAERFSTSRTPVREALALLEKHGLVEVPPRRRPRVHKAGIEEIRNIYEVRAALHALACELVAKRATSELLAQLRQKFDDMLQAVEAGDVCAYFMANMAFHDVISGACGNPLLQRSLDSLGLIAFNLRHREHSKSGRMHQSLEDHSLLMRALADHNPVLAAAAIRSNIDAALRVLEAQAAQEGESD